MLMTMCDEFIVLVRNWYNNGCSMDIISYCCYVILFSKWIALFLGGFGKLGYVFKLGNKIYSHHTGGRPLRFEYHYHQSPPLENILSHLYQSPILKNQLKIHLIAILAFYFRLFNIKKCIEHLEIKSCNTCSSLIVISHFTFIQRTGNIFVIYMYCSLIFKNLTW